MASIYELTADIQKLYDLLDKGELDEEMVRDAILNTEEEIGIKLDNYECFIKNLESDIKGLKEEEKRLKERRQSYENTVAEMKEAMGLALKATGNDKVKTSRFTFWLQKNNPSVVIDEPYIENIPSCFLIPQDPQIDKAKLKVALESEDEEVRASLEGIAHLERSESIRIR